MNYGLAKALEEAGFTQGGEGKWIFPPEKLVAHSNDRVYIPTLDEIIDACGEQFCSFTKIYTGNRMQGWQACSDKECFFSGEGATAKIAAAHLWLALNRKV
jgi:hypothetical protein